jgi:hypothetical protein
MEVARRRGEVTKISFNRCVATSHFRMRYLHNGAFYFVFSPSHDKIYRNATQCEKRMENRMCKYTLNQRVI